MFVALGEYDQAPSYWIVPARKALELSDRHHHIRTADIERYREAWELLDRSSARRAA